MVHHLEYEQDTRTLQEETKCKFRSAIKTRGPFLESPGNFSGPESYFMCAMFALKTQILLVLKAEQ